MSLEHRVLCCCCQYCILPTPLSLLQPSPPLPPSPQPPSLLPQLIFCTYCDSLLYVNTPLPTSTAFANVVPQLLHTRCTCFEYCTHAAPVSSAAHTLHLCRVWEEASLVGESPLPVPVVHAEEVRFSLTSDDGEISVPPVPQQPVQ